MVSEHTTDIHSKLKVQSPHTTIGAVPRTESCGYCKHGLPHQHVAGGGSATGTPSFLRHHYVISYPPPFFKAGIGVIKDLVEKFADQLDADVEGVGILDQYQAQIASALKPAFAPDAFPLVTCAAYVSDWRDNNSDIVLSCVQLSDGVTVLEFKHFA